MILGVAEIFYICLTPPRVDCTNCLLSNVLLPDPQESVCAADFLEAIMLLPFSGYAWF